MLPLLFMLVWIAFSANHALAHGCWSAPLGGVTIAACPGNMADGAPARAAEDR